MSYIITVKRKRQEKFCKKTVKKEEIGMERRRELLFRLLWWAAVAGVSWLALRYALVWLLPFLLVLRQV